MPRFFNRIRKQLAKENKFFQYSRYAVGEILLVVIGILIAIQIDSWNNDRQFEVIKRELSSDLLNELQYNIDRIKYLDTSTALGTSFKDIDSLLRLNVLALRGGLDTNEVLQILERPIYKTNSFNLNYDVYEQLKESKVLNSLDKEIQLAIKSYYSLIEREEYYNLESIPLINSAFEGTKYGYLEMRFAYWNDTIYYEDNASFFKKYPWVFDTTSKNYIDLKWMMRRIYSNIHRTRQRMVGIIEESEQLKVLLTTPKD